MLAERFDSVRVSVGVRDRQANGISQQIFNDRKNIFDAKCDGDIRKPFEYSVVVTLSVGSGKTIFRKSDQQISHFNVVGRTDARSRNNDDFALRVSDDDVTHLFDL